MQAALSPEPYDPGDIMVEKDVMEFVAIPGGNSVRHPERYAIYARELCPKIKENKNVHGAQRDVIMQPEQPIRRCIRSDLASYQIP
jgi:hypothetical protein